MSDIVKVDLSSAAITYRPAAGEQRCVLAGEVSTAALFRAVPWRTFRWYFGQRHYSGTYWSATEREHVIYESRLELANLVVADFDPTVHHIVAQRFQLSATVDKEERRHIPDYLWGQRRRADRGGRRAYRKDDASTNCRAVRMDQGDSRIDGVVLPGGERARSHSHRQRALSGWAQA
jgi:hypothetical protein